MIKVNRDLFSEIISASFNLAIDSGIFPGSLKIGKADIMKKCYKNMIKI